MKRGLLSFVIFLLLLSSASAQHLDSAQTGINKGRAALVTGATTTAYITGLTFLQFYWYRDHATTRFHYYNDNAGYLQMDKAGHAFSSYLLTHIGYHSMQWCGATKNQALFYAGVVSFLYMTPIEIFDGMNEGYGFSGGDIAANVLGATFFITQQALFNDQPIKPKFSYSPSGYARYRPGTLGASPVETFFMDYNGHTYWLSANIHSITKTTRVPQWLSVAFGYSANGMLGEFQNPEYYRGNQLPFFHRDRQFILSLDMDLSRIKTKNKFVKGAFAVLNLVKVPFPALELNGRGEVKGWWLYF